MLMGTSIHWLNDRVRELPEVHARALVVGPSCYLPELVMHGVPLPSQAWGSGVLVEMLSARIGSGSQAKKGSVAQVHEVRAEWRQQLLDREVLQRYPRRLSLPVSLFLCLYLCFSLPLCLSLSLSPPPRFPPFLPLSLSLSLSTSLSLSVSLSLSPPTPLSQLHARAVFPSRYDLLIGSAQRP